MRRLRFLAGARADIAAIYSYIETRSGSSDIAGRFARELNEQCRRLAKLPGMLGRPRPELRSDLRSIPYKGYVIFFRYLDDEIEIVNVLEGHRDIDTFFGGDE